MQTIEYSKRWLNPQFLSDAQGILSAVFISRDAVHDIDLRGLVIGLDGAPESLPLADFQDVKLDRVDLSYGRFSCAFSRAQFRDTKFEHAFFDTCRYKGANFSTCCFTDAYISSPLLDNAIFTDCSFMGTKIKGRGINEYGGRRIMFERCKFADALLFNLQLRGCTFRHCTFTNTIFKGCLMTNLKFEGQAPVEAAFVSCDRS
jgi:uncharacterized protein YjbI with pentapeptide repeats